MRCWHLLACLLLFAANSANAICTDTCVDINAFCNDTTSIYGQCICKSGYGYDENGTCFNLNLDGCSNSSMACDQNANCTLNSNGSYNCKCNPGYSGNGTICSDRNECQNLEDNCADNATCNNTMGSFLCSCNAGFEGDGLKCEDLDECNRSIATCDNTSQCSNTYGSFVCNCTTIGYVSNGTTCIDDDECSHAPTVCSNAVCGNTDGSFFCTCNAGYLNQSDGRCYDYDECEECTTSNCDRNAECSNTKGSFTCACGDGFFGNGTLGACIDVCESSLDVCDYNSTCSYAGEIPRSYICSCKLGYVIESKAANVTVPCLQQRSYTLSPACTYYYSLPEPGSINFTQKYFPDRAGFKSQYLLADPDIGLCVDFDECLNDERNTCDAHAECNNTDGSFTCSCKAGWNGTGIGDLSCSDINECATGQNLCDPNAACFNTNGSYNCICFCGFDGNGTYCEDIDECSPRAPINYTSQNAWVDNSILVDSTSASSNSSAAQLCALKARNVTNISFSVFFNNCDLHANCNNTVGSFTCMCPIGYFDPRPSGVSGINCTNKNECITGLHDCSPLADCNDTIGSFTCKCRVGFEGNGTTCADINECTQEDTCRWNATCTNTFGSFYCNCSEGYFGDDPTRCTACAPGSYKSSIGSINCTLCLPGKYGPHSTARNDSSCLRCQDNSTSPAGSYRNEQCLCNIGYTLTYAQLSTSSDNETNTTIHSESFAEFYPRCTACLAGKYKDFPGPDNCTVCTSGKYSVVELAASNESACVLCPAHSRSAPGAFNRTSCYCLPGFTSPTLLWNNTNCSGCLAGTYKSTSGSLPCLSCEAGKYSGKLGASAHIDCLNCTVFSHSPEGSTDVGNCTCNIGYTGTSLACSICPPATYKNISGSSQCASCPDNANSQPGSHDLLNCSCNAGYNGHNGSYCTACPRSFYSVESSPCVPCPENMTSDEASKEIGDCTCNTGFFGMDGTFCRPCPAGTYKDLIGSMTCQDCPAKSFSNQTGSNDAEMCTCNAGYSKLGPEYCNDVDECRDGHNTCKELASCSNTDGSFVCLCPSFYHSNGTSCFPVQNLVRVSFFLAVNISWFSTALDNFRLAFARAAGIGVSDVTIFNITTRLNYSQAQLRRSAVNSPIHSLRSKHASVKNALESASLLSLNEAGESLQSESKDRVSGCTSQCPIETWLVQASFDLYLSNLTQLAIVNDQTGFISNVNTEIFSLLLPQINVQFIQGIRTVCGDSAILLGETCDDGNSVSGDGCSNECRTEVGWSCLNIGALCQEVDECTTGMNSCSQYATCTNTNGSFVCSCLSTFLDVQGDGTVCSDFKSGVDMNQTQSERTAFSSDSVKLSGNIVDSAVIDVALFENTLLLARSQAGNMWLYERTLNQKWSTSPSHVFYGDNGCNFGMSIALSRDHAIAGTNAGCVYIYAKNINTKLWEGNTSQVLCRSESFFGTAVAIFQDDLLIGAYGASMAFLYRRTETTSWPEEPTVIFNEKETGGFYGHGLAITKQYLAIASLRKGAVYIYAKGLGERWSSKSNFTLNVPRSGWVGSISGRGFSLTEKHLFVGVPNGRVVFIYSRVNDVWPIVPTQNFSLDSGMFGYCVQNTDLYAVVSAYKSNRAHVFRSSSDGTWQRDPVQNLSEQGTPARFLGFSCALSNHDVVLGSFQSGSAFVYATGCNVGYYGWSPLLCEKCPPETTSPPISRYATNCSCIPGWYGPAGGPCTLCPANFWCPGGSQNFSCSTRELSSVGSSKLSDCKVNTFSIAKVWQTSNFPGAENHLYFSFATNNDFLINDGLMNVTVKGLQCSGGCKPCGNNSFDIKCRSPRCPLQFISFQEGNWTVDPVTMKPFGAGLYLNITDTLFAGDIYNFSFCVKNPVQGQHSPVFSVMATRRNVYAQPVLMEKGLDRSAPLSVLGISSARISQSTAIPLAANLLFVTIETYSFLSAGSSIVLTGLTGIKTTNRTIRINVPQVSPIAGVGSWDVVSGNLTLTLASNMDPGLSLSFSFELVNGNSEQFSPVVSVVAKEIRGSEMTDLLPVQMSTLPNMSAVLLISGFPVRNISQNSTVPGGSNQLTVTLRATMDLAAMTKLTISGLLNSGTASGNIPIGSATYSFSALGSWDQRSGSCILTVARLLPAGSAQSITFVLQNPIIGQAALQVSLIAQWSGGGSSTYSNWLMTSGASPPFAVAGIRKKSIGQTMAAPSCNNTVVVTLNFYVRLEYDYLVGRSPVINISGLTGSVGPLLDIRSIRPNATAWWEQSNVVWNSTTGSISLRVSQGHFLDADMDYVFGFKVVNGPSGQEAPTSISISVLALGWSLDPLTGQRYTMDQGMGDDAALVIAGFKQVTASQSSAAVNANNTIVITLVLYASLPAGSNLTITGLLNSTSPSQSLSLMQHPVVFLSRAVWNANRGSLVFTTASNLSGLVNYRFGFSVRNPRQSQAASTLVLSTRSNFGSTCIPLLESAVENAPGNSAPFLIAGFLVKSIRQTNSSQGAMNSVIIKLVSSVKLIAGSHLNLNGLVCSRCGCWACCKLSLAAVQIGDTAFWNGSTTEPAPINFDLGVEGLSVRSSYPLTRVSLILMRDMMPNVNHQFEFGLKNPLCGQSAGTGVNISVVSGLSATGADSTQISSTPMDIGLGYSAPFLRNYFMTATIRQETTGASMDNTISVKFRTIGPLAQDTEIYIEGLRNSQTSSGIITLSGENASAFSKATWENTSGTLHLLLRTEITAEAFYSFQFMIKNPARSQISPVISIAALDLHASTKAAMLKGKGAEAPFLIVSFLENSVLQSTSLPGANNKISILLSVTLRIPVGSIITISGLQGTSTDNGQRPLTFYPPGWISSPAGSWDQKSGSLEFNVEAIAANQLYNVSFELSNPLCAQPAVAVFISISGQVTLAKTLLLNAPGRYAPLLVTAEIEPELSQIGQSSPSAGQMNMITVTLATAHGFLSGPNVMVGFTLAGIKGASAGPGGLQVNVTSPKHNCHAGNISSSCSFGVQIYPSFIDSDGQIAFTVKTSQNIIVKSLQIQISVKNGDLPQSSPNISISSQDIGIPWTILEKDVDTKAPLLIAGFLFGNVSQTNPSQGANNDITLMFRVQTSLAIGSTILLSGLQGAKSTGTVNVILGSDMFNAAWATNSNTSIVFTALKKIQPSPVLVALAFSIENPDYFQDAPTIYLAGTGSVSMSPYALTFAQGNQAALLTAGFRVKSIAQSSVAAGSKNIFTVQLSLGTQIEGSPTCSPCTYINILGLRGSSSRPSVFISNASSLFEGAFAAGRLSLKVVSTILPNYLYVFYFELVNPDVSLESPSISIETTGATTVYAVEMSRGVGNNAPCLVAGFFIKNISQSTFAQGAPNTISLNVSFSVDILSTLGWALYLTNLFDIRLFFPGSDVVTTGTVPVAVSFNFGAATSTATVDFIDKSMFIPLRFKNISRKEPVVVSFVITNPLAPHTAPAVSIQLVQGNPASRSAFSTSASMDSQSSDLAPLFVNGLSLRLIQQSSTSASALNNITISLKAFGTLLAGTTFTLSGLIGSVSNSSTAMPLILLGDSALEATADWSKDLGRLIFRVLTDTRSLVSFSMTLRNPEQGQKSPTVSIEANTPRIERTEMVRGDGNLAPLGVAGFFLKRIGQSDPSRSVNNTISVTLACFVALGNESSITIFGLTGSTSPNNMALPVTSSVFDVSGRWYQVNGTLILRVAGVMKADTEYSLSFVLLNPAVQQSSPAISIEVHGTKVSQVRLDSANGNRAPLLIAGFVQISIGQSTPSPRANNTITATLSLNVILQPSSRAVFTIAGLVRSHTNASELSLTVTRNNMPSSDFGPRTSWDGVSGTLLLTVRFAILYPEFLYRVSFVLQNPPAAQDSPEVWISCGRLGVAPEQMVRGGGNLAPLLVAGFLTKAFGQSTPSASVLNTLTLTVSTRVQFPAQSLLTIAGLDGSSQLTTDSLSVQRLNASSPFRDRAVWDRARGTLVASLARPTAPRVAYAISFILLNPSAPQIAPAVSLRFAAPGVETSWEFVDSPESAAAPLVVSGFGPGRVIAGQSSASAAESNTLTVTLRTLVPLQPGTVIIISGLSGASLVFGALLPESIPVTGNFSQAVGGVGNFTPADGRLTMKVVSATEQRQAYHLSFTVINPPSGQLSPDISIEALGSVVIARTSVQRAPGPASPLAVSGFVTKTIGQSNATAGANNTLSLTLAFFVELGAGSVLTVSGLTGSATPDNVALPITANGSAFAPHGDWKQANGTLMLRAAARVEADVRYVVSFRLTNPGAAQAAPVVNVQAETNSSAIAAKTARMQIDAGAGNAAPLLVAGFTVFNVTQSTPSGGAQTNVITAAITANAALSNGSALTITGLTGSATSSTAILKVLSSPARTVAATGVWEQTIGVLVVLLARNIPANELWTFSFNITNPERGQTPTALPFAAVTSTAKDIGLAIALTPSARPMSTNAYPLRVAAFRNKSILQSTPSPGTNNQLVLLLACNVDLQHGTKVTLIGLTGSLTPTNQTLPIAGNGTVADGGPFANLAAWEQLGGTLVLNVTAVGGWAAGAVLELTFILRNPAHGQDSPAVSIEAGGAGITITRTATDAGFGAAAPLVVSDLIFKSMGQSTAAPGSDNTITATLAARVSLPAGTTIIISGLDGAAPAAASGPDGQTAFTILGFTLTSVSGNLSQKVGGRGNLTASGDMILILVADTAPDALYLLSFNISNPTSGQRSPRIFIQAIGPVAVLREAINRAPGPASPLAVSGFVSKTIGQSNATAGANNTLSLTLAFFVELGAGSVLTVSGLTGSATPDNVALPITANGSAFAPHGDWKQANGTLTLRAAARVEAEVTYVVSFTLTNPGAAQAARSVMIEVSGSGTGTSYATADRAPGLSSPLIVATWLTGCSVSGSTVQAGAMSNITLTFVAADAFSAGDTLTLTGLAGSLTAYSSPLPTLTSVFGGNASDAGGSADANSASWHGNWSNVSSEAVFALDSRVPPGALSVITFTLANPARGQEAPLLSLNGLGATSLAPTLCPSKPDSIPPFLVQSFLSVQAEQQSPFPSHSNVLRLNFSTRSAVVAPAEIVISGLFGIPAGRDTSVQLCLGSGQCRSCNATAIDSQCSNGAVANAGSGTGSFGSTNSSNESFSTAVCASAMHGQLPVCIAEYDAAAGRLTVALRGNTQAKIPYVINVSFTNPLSPRASVAAVSFAVSTTAGGDGAAEPTFAILAHGNRAPLLVAGWNGSALAVGQSTAAAEAVNTITVTFAATAAFIAADGVAITIAGLAGSNTPNGMLPVDAPPQFAAQATWWANGTAVLRLVSDTTAGSIYSVNLHLLNPAGGRDAAGPIVVSASSSTVGLLLSPAVLVPAAGSAAPLAIAGWTAPPVLAFVSISGTSAYPTVFLSSRLQLPGYFGSKTTISGLAGSDTPGLNAQLRFDPPSTIFGSYARWFQVSGKLILITQRESAMAGVVYNVSVPKLALNRSLPNLLMGTGRVSASFATLYAAGPLIASSPLFVPGFQGRALGAIGSSEGQPINETPGAVNTVYVTLVPNLAFQCQLKLTISGLMGGWRPSGGIDVNVNSSTHSGSWNKDAGILTLGLSVNLSADSSLILSFGWTNGQLQHPFSNVSIAASCMRCDLVRAQPGGLWRLVDTVAHESGYHFPAVVIPYGPLGNAGRRRMLTGQHRLRV